MRLGMVLTIVGMAVATYLTRATLLVFGGRINFPPLFLRSLRYVPIAVISAIVFPAVLAPSGHLEYSPLNPYLLAALATAVVARLTRNSVAGMVVGMALILVLRVMHG